jgi:hypothetical protein
VNQGALEPPVFEKFGHQIHGVAFADSAKVQSHIVLCRTNDALAGLELERVESGAERDVEGSPGNLVHMPRDHEALERGR